MLGLTRTVLLLLLALHETTPGSTLPAFPGAQHALSKERKDATVLILGGGVAGVTAARTLHEQGIDDFIILEARHELGGRMMSHTFGAAGGQWTVEVGANWVQGTQTGDGPANPVWELAKKHNVSLRSSHNFDDVETYDDGGAIDFQDVFQQSIENFRSLTATAGARVPNQLVDMSARSGYALSGARPDSRFEMASEYFQFDWEFGATPEETSWLASSWAHNHTFKTFSAENLLSVDQRGFKTLIQAEAAEFLSEGQVRLNATVSAVFTSKKAVVVLLSDGTTLSADHALCTFSLGVLQHDDVRFIPPLPTWKQEAIHSMAMGTYTKIFMQFPEKFWFDTEIALYADYERGRYPVWQTLDHPEIFPGSGIHVTRSFPTGRRQGTFSQRIESMPDAAVQAEILSVLRSMFPNATIPEPLDFYFQRWHSDPLFRGSYSNWPANFLSEHQGNLRADVDKRLWFAGEATSKKWFGYLHGAYTEGQDIALTLAGCIEDGECEELEHLERVRNALPYDVE